MLTGPPSLKFVTAAKDEVTTTRLIPASCRLERRVSGGWLSDQARAIRTFATSRTERVPLTAGSTKSLIGSVYVSASAVPTVSRPDQEQETRRTR